MTSTCADSWSTRSAKKEARKQCVSSRTHSSKRAKCETMHQWGYEKFLAEIGRDRALAWIASGKIKSIPDPKSQRCAHILCRATRNSLSRQTKYPDQSQLQPMRARSMSKTWTFCKTLDLALRQMSRSNGSLNLMRASSTRG